MSTKFVLASTAMLCHDAAMARELTARELQSLGGKARAKKLTSKQRKDSARKAAQARWAKPRKAK